MAIDLRLLAETLHPLELSAGELQELSAALECPSDSCIRLRTFSPTAELPFATESVPWHPRGRWVNYADRPGARLAFAAGDYYVQDAGSLLALTLAAIQPGETVCDLCASPGGKSTAVLEELGGSGWLLANEAVQSRLPPLQFNLARHGATNYLVSCHDPEPLQRALTDCFDVVLVDAPCSGQSLVGRGKQTAAAFQAATVEHCARRQARILAAAAALVRPGGRLIYSTCTFAFAENEGCLAQFLADHAGWQLGESPELAAWRSPALAGCYRLWPQRDRCAGAFAALLCKTPEHEQASAAGGARTRQNQSGRLRSGSPPAESTDWGTLAAGSVSYVAGDQVSAWPAPPPPPLLTVSCQGPEFAFRKNTTWFPAYALAMRRDASWRPARQVELADADAARYVRGETVACGQRGWSVATWRERPLGWLKGDGRSGKNHLPKPGRLRVVDS